VLKISSQDQPCARKKAQGEKRKNEMKYLGRPVFCSKLTAFIQARRMGGGGFGFSCFPCQCEAHEERRKEWE
jgi:hypothetical protein